MRLIQNHLWFLVIMALSAISVRCASTPHPYAASADIQQIRQDLRSTSFDVPFVANQDTARWLDFYQTRGRKHFTTHLERSGRYIPMMRAILKEHGLPQDLVYMALIESGFSAHAYSSAAAVGFWQFIRGTGKRYQLEISEYLDERRDFEKSTHAAANYLKDLYRRFGDWNLAMSAYNAGEYKIEKAIDRHGTRDYWRLIQFSYLRPETKNYIPKFQAAALIAKNPEHFGFHHLQYHTPFQYEEVTIEGGPVDLRVAARLAKTNHDELETLNPELSRWFTPPHRRSYTLRVPQGKASRLKQKFASLPQHRRMGSKAHKVISGETLAAIAERYNVDSDFLAMANGLSGRSKLSAGQMIGIPDNPPPGKNRYAYRYQGATASDGKRLQHKVKNGESLWKIARHYKVSLKDLQKWNQGRIGKHLKTGQVLYVYASGPGATKPALSPSTTLGTGAVEGPAPAMANVAKQDNAIKKENVSKTKTYKVKSGDTLSQIAARHGVSLQDLKTWNRDKLGNYLKAGQTLVLHGTEATTQLASVRELDSAPVVPKVPAQKTAAPAGHTYRVKPGDTLWGIAEVHDVSIGDLKRWNGEEIGRYLKPGQKLAIHGAAAAIKPAATPPSATPNKTPIYHTVQAGDTLWDIARQYKVSTQDLKDWNGIEQVKRLRPGNRLKIFVERQVSQEV